MPELPVKDLHLSELHFPELKRDDILRTLSEIERPKIDLPSIDLGKTMASAAAAAHLGRRDRPTRWPFAVGGLIVAGLATWAILTNETVRSKIGELGVAVRERIAAMRAGDDRLEVDRDDPIAFDAAETHPIEPSAFGDTAVEATGYPAGLGSNNGDDQSVFEASSVGD